MAQRQYSKAMGVDEGTSSRPVVEAPFGAALVELGIEWPEIVGLTADLGKYTDILPFRNQFPPSPRSSSGSGRRSSRKRESSSALPPGVQGAGVRRNR